MVIVYKNGKRMLLDEKSFSLLLGRVLLINRLYKCAALKGGFYNV